MLSQRFRSIPVPGGQEVCDVEPGLIDRDLLKDRCDFREDLHQTAGIFPVGGKIRRDEDQVGALLQGFYYRLSGADPVLFCRNGFGCNDPVARFDIASDCGGNRAQIHTSRRKAQLFQRGPGQISGIDIHMEYRALCGFCVFGGGEIAHEIVHGADTFKIVVKIAGSKTKIS